jgi:hypothetical protein
MEIMSGDEMREHLKGKSQEEAADFIRENEIIKIEERIKKNKKE